MFVITKGVPDTLVNLAPVACATTQPSAGMLEESTKPLVETLARSVEVVSFLKVIEPLAYVMEYVYCAEMNSAANIVAF